MTRRQVTECAEAETGR